MQQDLVSKENDFTAASNSKYEIITFYTIQLSTIFFKYCSIIPVRYQYIIFLVPVQQLVP